MKKYDAIMSVLPSKENTSKDIKTDKVEMEIKQKCLQQGVYYIKGKKEENKYECRKRRKQLRSKIKSTQSGSVEIELRQQCLQYGVRYIDREKDESRKKCMKRDKLMHEHIQNTYVSSKDNKIMENNGDDIDFLVEFPDKDGNSFHAPSMADQNEMKTNESSFLRANPKIHKMVQMFNDGELFFSFSLCIFSQVRNIPEKIILISTTGLR